MEQAPQALYVANVTLYLFSPDSGQYEDYGQVGCTIMGTPNGAMRLGCYNDSGEYVCTANILTNNETSARVALQGSGYVSFKDAAEKTWSMQFPSEDEAVTFGAHLTVAMYSAAGEPHQNIVACDVNEGKRDRMLFANDRVKVRYTSWVVQRGTPGAQCARLGSELETNANDEKPYAFTVPANHLGVSPDMKGFEGMVVGVGEEGRRYVVIPQAAKRGGGPNVHMCFHVSVLRKKDNTENLQQQASNKNGSGQLVIGGGGGSVSSSLVSRGRRYSSSTPPRHRRSESPDERSNKTKATTAVVPQGPPPGFNAEQLMVIDRLRDQVQQLTLQLRDATQKTDGFRHDFIQHDRAIKPKSLASAQVEHSLQKLLEDTENLKDELTKRDQTLRQVEEKNRELQGKVDRFSNTANQLAGEKKAAINQGSEEKIDLDRRIAQLQGQITRVQGEREDVSRHMSTVKRLLEVSDQDLKAENSKLQTVTVHMQTNETKLATTEENLLEERARRKILESKCVSLGDELRRISEETRSKQGQIEERRRKMNADKLHFTQMMEDERTQAASELRDLRQELIDELAIRDRRYQEERARVAQEAFERGRIQGVDDGYNDATLEAETRIQELGLAAQRCKSEVEGIKVRLRQAQDQSEADQRRLNSQIAALNRALDDLTGTNNATEVEITALQESMQNSLEKVDGKIRDTIGKLTRPVQKKDLLTMIHQLRTSRPVSYEFESMRQKEQEDSLVEEEQMIREWTRGVASHVLRNNEDDASSACAEMPPLTPVFPDELPTFPTMATDAQRTKEENKMAKAHPEKSLESVVREFANTTSVEPEEDENTVVQRYKELLAQIDEADPDLNLVPKPPPKEPTPPPSPTPEPEPQEPEAATEPVVQEEAEDQGEEGGRGVPTTATSSSSVDEEEEPDASVRAPPAQPSGGGGLFGASDDDDESDDGFNKAAPIPKQKAAAPKRAVPKRDMFGDSDDEDEEADDNNDRSRIPPATAAAPPSAEEDEPQQQEPAAAPSKVDEAETPAAAGMAPKAEDTKEEAEEESTVATVVPAPKKRSHMFDDDDDSDEDDASSPSPLATSSAAKKKPVAPPKRAAPSSNMFADDSDDGGSEEQEVKPKRKASQPPGGKKVSKKPAAAVKKKKSMFDDSDDDDSDSAVPLPKAKPAPKKKASAKRAAVLKKKSMFDDSDDSD